MDSDPSRLPNGPNLWRAILAEMPEGAIVAGGAVRDFLLGYEPKDIDVFMAIPPVSSEPIPFPDLGAASPALCDVEFGDPRHGLLRIENTHERYEEYTAVSNIVCVSSGTLLGWRVDAVDLDDFEGGQRLASQFDFGITRCWFDGEIHDTPEARHDRENHCVTLLLDARRERSIARFERLKERWGADWTLRDSDRNPEGEKPQALSAEHESAGPKDIANT